MNPNPFAPVMVGATPSSAPHGLGMTLYFAGQFLVPLAGALVIDRRYGGQSSIVTRVALAGVTYLGGFYAYNAAGSLAGI